MLFNRKTKTYEKVLPMTTTLIALYDNNMNLNLPSEIKNNFFYDNDTILNYSYKDLEILKGYLILLKSDDISLKVSALIDGTVIDYLYGLTSKNKINNNTKDKLKHTLILKKFINELLNDKQKNEICIFYYNLYSIIIEYYNNINQLIYIIFPCFIKKFQHKMFDDIKTSYIPLYRSIYRFES